MVPHSLTIFSVVAASLLNLISGIIDLKLYSYGNAHEKKLPDGHYSYTCQHGSLECLGNFIEACIQKKTNFKPELYFPIIECMEAARNPILVAKQCFEIFTPELKWNDVHLCAHVSSGVYNVILRPLAINASD